MSRPLKLTGILAFFMLLQGCVSTYAPAPDEKTATVRSVGFGQAQICKEDRFYFLPTANEIADGHIVPAGQRLTIGAHLISSGYPATYVCRPFLSFIPAPGQIYVMNSALDGYGRCIVELVRADPSSKTGLAIEPSVAKAECPLKP